MIYIENVQGSAEAATPFIINVDTIYVHTNITKLEPKENEIGEIVDADLYSYNEYQYTFEEFRELGSAGLDIIKDDLIDEYTLLLVEKGVL